MLQRIKHRITIKTDQIHKCEPHGGARKSQERQLGLNVSNKFNSSPANSVWSNSSLDQKGGPTNRGMST